PRLHVVARILTGQDEMARRLGDRVLDQRAREDQPALVGQLRSDSRAGFDAGRDRIGEPDILQHVERGMMDFDNVGFAERLELAAFEARPHRLYGIRHWRRPQRASCFPATPASLRCPRYRHRTLQRSKGAARCDPVSYPGIFWQAGRLTINGPGPRLPASPPRYGSAPVSSSRPRAPADRGRTSRAGAAPR